MEDNIRLERNKGFYEKYIKRILDIICSLLALIVFGWLYIVLAVLVKIKLGSPVIFRQPRPGMVDPKTGKETIFYMYKFRSMSNEKDEEGNLLSDHERLNDFGKKLRGSSLDELPEVFNILKGDMSVVGPRPQLVRDMVFMTPEQRMRHTARPGLTGLAQIKGRNALIWENKLEWDLKYIENVSFINDVIIVIETALKVFFKSNVNEEGIDETDLTSDFGDYLLEHNKITQDEYDHKQNEATVYLKENG